jgi:putative chitinase
MSLKALQEKIGVLADGSFGPKTLKAATTYFKFTPERAAHFFGQVATETGNFAAFSENLNYSADGLQRVFGKYFPGDLEKQYARQPEKIANRVYGSRMGNGSEASGDGWKYRGRGAIQLTGKSNYQTFATYLKNAAIMENPDLVATTYAFESAIFFFERNRLWQYTVRVDHANILKLSRAINTGNANSTITPHGLDSRVLYTEKFYSWLK